MNYLEKIAAHLSGDLNRPYAIRLFSLLVYGWFLINALLLWSTKDLLWGNDNVFFRQGQADSFIENFFYQLIYAPSRYHMIFYSHVVCAAISLAEKKWSFVPRMITWMTGMMLYFSAVEAFNSGMLLMLLLAFYCSVIQTKSTNSYSHILTHLAIYACIAQIVLVYLVSSVYKLSGGQWPSGEAVYYALHIDHFSSAFWIDNGLVKISWLMHLLTYSAFLYQLSFPLFVWFKKTRKWLLIAGITFHLFIGLFMHLWDFALAMIFSYAVFMSDATAKRILIFRTLRH